MISSLSPYDCIIYAGSSPRRGRVASVETADTASIGFSLIITWAILYFCLNIQHRHAFCQPRRFGRNISSHYRGMMQAAVSSRLRLGKPLMTSPTPPLQRVV